MTLFNVHTHDAIRIFGPDAHKLLNDTLTCRFDDGLNEVMRWFALLSPQGKVQTEGLITQVGDDYYVDIEAGLVADFIKRMKLYRLRANVDFDWTKDLLWSPDGETPKGVAVVAARRDERSTLLGTRFITDGPPDGLSTGDQQDAFGGALAAATIPEFGPDFGVNDVFPHDIGMDLLGGIDFKKGCYIGQEVVSRMQHRGTARRRPVMVSGLHGKVAMNTPLMVGEREAGTVGTNHDGTGIAIVRVDRVPNAGAATVGGIPVKLAIPAWGTYGFGESGSDG